MEDHPAWKITFRKLALLELDRRWLLRALDRNQRSREEQFKLLLVEALACKGDEKASHEKTT